jgi:signal transduction histidine kinase
MVESNKNRETFHSNLKLPDDFRALSHAILTCANRGEPKVAFLREVTELMMNFSGCDAIRIVFKDGDKYSCASVCSSGGPADFRLEPCSADLGRIEHSPTVSILDQLAGDVLRRNFDPSLPFFTPFGSFWTGNADLPLEFGQVTKEYSRLHGLVVDGDHLTVAIIPILVIDETVGMLNLHSRKRNFLTKFDLPLYETVAQALGVALMNHGAQAALRERVKELTCLYGIATLSEQPGISAQEILQGIVSLFPPAWQYPEITCARIMFDDQVYSSQETIEGSQRLCARIVVHGNERGAVEVAYSDIMPDLDEGPFLKEERKLIDTVASQIALIVERKQAEEERQKLHDQLRHADRLATIGQLAAGVAHELNEPLGSILGFAQLAGKTVGDAKEAAGDIQKIINAALHAREVVKKLMLFSRQMPTRKEKVNLNKIIREGLYFLEARASKAGVEMVKSTAPDLPLIFADQSQIYQVLVNLAVNAVQAMPDGGKLTITTESRDDQLFLIVEDTGIGMNSEVLGKLFMPFFTTKDINEGTGLGLSVVHGIVTSHGGEIKVESEIGRGSRFVISLPSAGFRGAGGGDD